MRWLEWDASNSLHMNFRLDQVVGGLKFNLFFFFAAIMKGLATITILRERVPEM